jgi:hypothetical protein
MLAATRVFTGTELLEQATVHVSDGLVIDVTPGLAPGAEVLDGTLVRAL